MTNRTRPRRALFIAALSTPLLILALAGCPGASQDPGGSHKPSAPPSNSDCGYTWDPCTEKGTFPATPDPNTSTYHSIYDTDTPAPSSHSQPPLDHQQSATWGDMKFGDCSVSLWPARVGVGVTRGFYAVPNAPTQNGTRAAIYGEASTVCVGYQPKEFAIDIHLQQWSNVAHGSAPVWHDAPSGPHDQAVLASSDIPPIGIINPATGQPPFSMQHIYHVWTPCLAGATVTYRLQIHIVGVSYGGSPIVGGGIGQTFTSLPGDC